MMVSFCSASPGRQKIKSDADIGAIVVSRQWRHGIGIVERTQARIVEGCVAAGFRDADIFDRAVAVDRKGGDRVNGARGASGGIDAGLKPVLSDPAADG